MKTVWKMSSNEIGEASNYTETEEKLEQLNLRSDYDQLDEI